MRAGVLDWLRRRVRALRALVAREMLTRYGRHNIGFMWLVAEPVLFSAAIAALWSAVRGPVNPAMSVAGFALTGYATVQVWRNAASRCTSALSTNWALLYHAAIEPLDLYTARIVIEALSATAGLAVSASAMVALGLVQPMHDPVGVALAWMALLAFGAGFALVVGGLASHSETFERIWHMLAYLLFPLSGAPFMADWLPEPLRQAALWVPMVHITEWLRGAWFGPSVITHEDPVYLLGCAAALAVLGLGLIRRRGRVIEVPA